MSEEGAWLDYAWKVISCSDAHRRACIAAGAATAGEGRADGNELRWPGYLGRNYMSGHGVLCVGAVHREHDPAKPAPFAQVECDRVLVAAARTWLAAGRSPAADAGYLEDTRRAYEMGLLTWGRWRRHFRTLIEDYLDLDVTQIACANIAKCRVPIDRGEAARRAEAKVQPLCERDLVPMLELVGAIRPAAVLVASLKAAAGGGIVTGWDPPAWSPLVYCWQGQSGHDRHNTDPRRRNLDEWARDAVPVIVGRQLNGS